jgi:heat shock protein HslJ
MTRLIAALLVLLVVLAAAGCGATASPSPSPSPSAPPTEPPLVLEGTSWRATLIGDEEPAPANPVSLALGAGRVEGNTGCNSYGADAELDGGRLVVGEVQTTLAACVEELPSRLEGEFLRILQERPAVVTDGTRLLLRGTSGEIVLEPGPPAP